MDQKGAQKLTTYVAVLGHVTMMPGRKKAKVGPRGAECIVAHKSAPKIVDDALGLEVDTSDCTIFVVTHLWEDRESFSPTQEHLLAVLDEALLAISEILTWEKAQDVVRRVSPYARQVGRLDVKYFFVEGEGRSMAVWRNPAFWASDEARAVMSGFLDNLLVTNGPAENPLPSDLKRVLAAFDLLNLGFFTEAFITLFALADDLVQRVVRKGLEQRGLDENQQKDILQSITEMRLRRYLTSVMTLCGWESFDDANPDDFKTLMKANRLRNQIMHGDRRIDRQEVLDSMTGIFSMSIGCAEIPSAVSSCLPLPR